MRRWGTIALLLLLPLLLAGTCTPQAPPRPGADEQGPLVVGTTESLGASDPAACYDVFCAYVVFANTHDGLTRIDPETLEPRAALASDWAVSDDGETYRFTLRDGLAFHDGTPFDADAMRASLERIRDRERGGGRFLLFGEGGVRRVSAPDDQTLEVELAAPDAAFLAKLAFPVAAAVPPGGDPSAGTGPFSVADRGPDLVELAADPSHRDGPPREDAVLLRRFRSSAGLRAALARGDVHLAVRRWDASELAGLEDDPAVRLEATPDVAVRFLAFTTAHEPYDDPALRRAVAAAVDRPRILEASLGGAAEPLHSLVPPAFAASAPVFAEVEAGDAPAEGTGLQLWYTPSHYGEAEEEAARAVAGSLEEAGFEVTLGALAWPDLKASLAGGGRPGIVLLGRFPDALDPADHLVPLLGSQGAAALGVGYASEEMDELLAEQAAATDPERRRELLVEVQELAAADAPYVPLWLPHRIVAVHEGVSGLELGAAPHLPLSGVESDGG